MTGPPRAAPACAATWVHSTSARMAYSDWQRRKRQKDQHRALIAPGRSIDFITTTSGATPIARNPTETYP